MTNFGLKRGRKSKVVLNRVRVKKALLHLSSQSRMQNPQALWPVVSRQERLGELEFYFCGKTMQTVTRQPIKKFK